jgi:sugar phosphate isomerase/epimerase
MGKGVIQIQKIIDYVKEAGFEGYNEVEIFSDRHWAEDQDIFLDRIIKAYLNYNY